MGVALWPVAGPACVRRNGTTVRTHAIRSLKSRPVVVLPPSRLTTVTPPPTRAPRAPFAATTCTPSVPHESVGSRRPPGASPACASPIFVRCASPPGTAYTPLSARLCSARAPRGSTRGPRGAGGPSGPWEATRTCSAGTSWHGRLSIHHAKKGVQEFRKLQVGWVLSLYGNILT